MQILPQEGSLSTQLGQALGRGLSETLPEGIKRGQLSEGIRALSQGTPKRNPTERIAQYYAIPGMTSDLASQLENMAKAKLRSTALDKRPESRETIKEKVDVSPRGEEFSEQVQDGPIKMGESEWIPDSQLRKFRSKRAGPPTTNDMEELYKQFESQGLIDDPVAGRKQVKELLNEQYETQEKQRENLRNKAQERLQTVLQRPSGVDEKIWGKLQQSLIDQIESKVLDQGMSLDEAASQMDKLAYGLAEQLTSLDTIAKGKSFFELPTSKLRDVKSLRKNFEKIGAGYEFDQIAASKLGVNPIIYAQIVEPLQNKEVSQHMGRGFYSNTRLDKIAKGIKPEDNLLAIFGDLDKQGVNPDRLKEIISDKYTNKLSSRQERQLQVPITQQKGLNDIYLTVFGKR